jgi:hypothetical protein
MSEVNDIIENLASYRPISKEDAQKFGHEYGRLMIKESLSEKEDARVDELLHIATIHENVDHYISEAIRDYGKLIGLLSPEALSYYEDQRSVLRERLGLPDAAGEGEALLNEFDLALKRLHLSSPNNVSSTDRENRSDTTRKIGTAFQEPALPTERKRAMPTGKQRSRLENGPERRRKRGIETGRR